MDQNVPGQSHCRSFKSTISFLYADTNSWKLKIEKFYMVKKECGYYSHKKGKSYFNWSSRSWNSKICCILRMN